MHVLLRWVRTGGAEKSRTGFGAGSCSSALEAIRDLRGEGVLTLAAVVQDGAIFFDEVHLLLRFALYRAPSINIICTLGLK